MFGSKPGHRIIELAETDSTNSYAARLLHDKFPEEGTVIVAGYQQSGRGQRGSSWESERGKNLLISYILYPNFLDIRDQFLLNKVIALSVLDCVRANTNKHTEIKWPNDILADGKKIAGILIENSIRNSKITHATAGIGINVNQLVFEDYNFPATSLALLEGKNYQLQQVLKTLNNALDKWYNMLRIGNYELVKNAYLEVLFRYQINSKFESEGKLFNGKITGISDDGYLEILRDDQTITQYKTKEVKFLL